MIIYKDQLNRSVALRSVPNKIISVVPSQTELLHYLGLENEVIGITKFCIYPNNWFLSKTKIGGTKNLNIEKIVSLNPDLIIANKEENSKEDIDLLEKIAPVYISDIYTINDAFDMIENIGNIVNKRERASNLIALVQQEFNLLKTITNINITCSYLIWNKPYMTIGNDTFINNMLHFCGFINCFANKNRYPEITIDEIKEANPNVIFLSSEPFPFKQIHIKELQIYLPNTKIILVDGEMFSWYGSRLLLAPKYFAKLIEDLL